MAQLTGFSSLPSELIVRILSYLDSLHDVLSIGLVARELHACTLESTVWRSTYLKRWQYGRYINNGTTTTTASINTQEVSDWCAEYKRRHELDGWIDDTVHKLIYPPPPPNHARIPRYREIREWDIDIKDRLLQHIHCADDAEDVLARRYWARTMLQGLYRRQAVQCWRDLADDKDVSLEQAVCAFEHFIADDADGDYQSTAAKLDTLAQDFKRTQWEYASLGARGQALMLAHYLRNIEGYEGISNYESSLRNNFVGLTMSSATREGLPINYAVIFCALASRLGIDARPCNFPWHIYVVITAPEGKDLAGKPVETAGAGLSAYNRTYLDLFALDGLEVSETYLRTQLEMIPDIPRSEYESALQPASVKDLVLRVRNNIMRSIHRISDETNGFGAQYNDNARFFDRYQQDIMYAIVWMTMLLAGEDEHTIDRRRSHVGYLLQPMQRSYPGDWYLFEEMILPLFEGGPIAVALRRELQSIRRADLEVPEPKLRHSSEVNQPHFKVGVLFTHKRYGYSGMIIGWDLQCEAPEVWQRQQRIDELDHGRMQCFYNIISSDGTDRYVAQENIGPTPALGPDDALFRMAGRYFLRWDKSNSRFVSNLRTQYPDD